MADFATLWLKLRNQQFNTGMDKSNAKTEKLGRSGLKTAGIIAAVGIPLFLFSKNAVKAASDAGEVADKFGTVFEGAGNKAEQTAKKIAKSYGIAISTSKELLSSTGDVLSGFGFTDKAALKLSARVTKLGSDLASFSNIEGGAKRATRALTSAITGMPRAVLSLGIVIRKQSKEYKKLVAEGVNLRGETLLQAQAMATLTMAIKQSPKAIGDTQRTWNSFANTARRLTEHLKEFREQSGKLLIAIFGLTDGMNDFDKIINKITKSMIKNGNTWVFIIQTWAIEIKSAMRQSWASVSWLFGNINAVIKAAKTNITSFYTWYKKSLKTGEFAETTMAVLEDFGKSAIDFWDAYKKSIDKGGRSWKTFRVDVGRGMLAGIAALGARTDEVLAKYKRELILAKPDFRGWEELSKKISRIEGERSQAQKKLFDDAIKNANKLIKKEKEKGAARAKAALGGAKGFVEATFAGTIKAQQREFGASTSEKKIEKNTGEIAKATRESAKANKKLAQSLERPPIYKMA